MFYVEWVPETNGVVLALERRPESLTVTPRPVFWEELDMLGLALRYRWEYPHCEEPLMWACNRQYFYKGKLVFEVKTANVYDKAELFFHTQEKLSLIPVNIESLLDLNKDALFVLENEAIDFIRDTYETYSKIKKNTKSQKADVIDYEALAKKQEKATKQKMALIRENCDSFDIMPLEYAQSMGKKIVFASKIDKFLASFSGGKDSQVVLDLCTRAIPPSAFEVVYSDTGYELPPSLELYYQVQNHYKAKHPDLKFSTAKNHESVLHYWDTIGTPSDTHRWCCAVMKTAPLYRSLKLEGTNRQAQILTFDGVRAEESTRRSTYARIGKGVKHDTVVNASPILYWSTTEIFLYLFKYNLPINPAYRMGMTRVGCLICPFSSEWNDMVSNTHFGKELAPFLSRVRTITEKSGVRDINDYIKTGKWKRRAGGRDMDFPSSLIILETKPDLIISVTSPQKNLMTWMSAVGKYQSNYLPNGDVYGTLYFDKTLYDFEIVDKGNTVFATFKNTGNSPTLQGLIKRAINKATYCINCEACEVECPTGALSILPDAKIDEAKCVHCHKCLKFHDLGCISANSLSITGDNTKNTTMKLDNYNNFGLREEWLDFYLAHFDNYMESDHGLNTRQQVLPFFKWLHHAGIVIDTRSKKISPFGKKIVQIYEHNRDLAWELIWINLCYGSASVKWFHETLDWEQAFSAEDIQEMIKEDYPEEKDKSVGKIRYALFRTLKESPFGNAGQLIPVDDSRFMRSPITSVSKEAVAYSIYKYAEACEVKTFKVSDLYSGDRKEGIYWEFGIPRNELERVLLNLSTGTTRYLIAELNMGLEHISLLDNVSSEDVLDMLIRNL